MHASDRLGRSDCSSKMHSSAVWREPTYAHSCELHVGSIFAMQFEVFGVDFDDIPACMYARSEMA